MTVEEKVQSVLVADAALIALVTSSHIRVIGDNQGLSTPYIVHFPVSVRQNHMHSGLARLRFWDYQISVFAASYSSARAIASRLIALLGDNNFSGVQFMCDGIRAPMFESESSTIHIPVQFRISEAL